MDANEVLTEANDGIKVGASYAAGSEAIGRGETLTLVHASELAFWSPSTAKENWNALLQAVPNEKGTAIIRPIKKGIIDSWIIIDKIAPMINNWYAYPFETMKLSFNDSMQPLFLSSKKYT